MVNVGTISGPPSPPPSQGGDGQARRRLMAPGWDGGSVVVRGRESRPHGEGTQRVQQRRTGNGRSAPVNTDDLWPDLDEAESQVLRMQAKLHQWATDSPDRRFGDLYNLVCRSRLPRGGVASGAGQSWGTVGRSRRSETELHPLRRRDARRAARGPQGPALHAPSREGTDDPEGERQAPPPRHPDRPGPGRASLPEAGPGANLRGGLQAVQLRLPPEAPGPRRHRRDPPSRLPLL